MSDGVALVAFVAIAVAIAYVLQETLRARRAADRSLASLDALLEHAPVGIAFLDRDLRFLRVNDTLAQMDRRTVDQLGRSLDEVFGRPELTALARSVLETGQAVPDVQISALRDQVGRVHTIAGYYPVFGPDGAIDGVGVVVRDVSAAVVAEAERDALLESERAAHLAAELAADRLSFLAEASDILAGSLDWAHTLQGIAALSIPRLADFAAVFVVEDGRIQAIEMAHADPGRVPALRALVEHWPAELDQRSGLGAVARTGEAILVRDIQPEQLRA